MFGRGCAGPAPTQRSNAGISAPSIQLPSFCVRVCCLLYFLPFCLGRCGMKKKREGRNKGWFRLFTASLRLAISWYMRARSRDASFVPIGKETMPSSFYPGLQAPPTSQVLGILPLTCITLSYCWDTYAYMAYCITWGSFLYFCFDWEFQIFNEI